jgi:hypothetical protein
MKPLDLLLSFSRLSLFPWFAAMLLACDDERRDRETADDEAVAADAFFLPTGDPDNTSAPTIELDAAGGIHAVYPAYGGGSAYYAYCAPGCQGAQDVALVRLETDSAVANVMIALDGSGHPQLLLSSFADIYYARCEGDCTDAAAWSITDILKHDNHREVTGEAFALDPQGRPRFVMHTYVAYLGIGQEAPETHYVTCDGPCDDAASWGAHRISDQIWQSSHLRFDADGRAHLATVATVPGEGGALPRDVAAYVLCEGDCTREENWVGSALMPAFSSPSDIVTMRPAIAMALTATGAPRIVVLGQDDDGLRNVAYLACDEACTTATWNGTILSQTEDIGPGVDIALDDADRPRLVYTFDFNIALASCDDDACESADAPWELVPVERGGDLPPDEIFLWPNCNVGAWFLHSPSLAIDGGGRPRVGYQARDLSGGWTNPDPTVPDCQAGTDLTWSRLALVPAM